MLRLPVESLWDEVLPEGVRELPKDLAALDELLRDLRLLEPIASSWQQQTVAQGRHESDGAQSSRASSARG